MWRFDVKNFKSRQAYFSYHTIRSDIAFVFLNCLISEKAKKHVNFNMCLFRVRYNLLKNTVCQLSEIVQKYSIFLGC